MGFDTRTLPIRDRFGRVRSLVLVSAEDYPELAKHRWYRQGRGYAARTQTTRACHCPTCRCSTRKTILMHRQIMGLDVGDPLSVDHVNGDGFDNRRANLRACTHAENMQNQRSRAGRSSFRGVHFKDGKWCAQVGLNYRRINLGRFATEEEAHAAASAFRGTHLPFSVEAQ